jgi:oligoribonuclease (3'-5' exoribonuclease)
VESDFSHHSFPEVTRQMIEEYNKTRVRGFPRKWPFFTEICGNSVKTESRRFYSEDDWPMGEYILKKMLNLSRKCELCKKPCYLHTEVYYGKSLYVRIEAETRIVESDN